MGEHAVGTAERDVLGVGARLYECWTGALFNSKAGSIQIKESMKHFHYYSEIKEGYLIRTLPQVLCLSIVISEISRAAIKALGTTTTMAMEHRTCAREWGTNKLYLQQNS